MSLTRRTLLLLAGCAAGAGAAQQVHGAGKIGMLPVPGFDTPSLPPALFDALHRAAAPKAELWTQIPWETDLLQAQQLAAREKKPLLMWVMDGHPLGCT
jgi:hypothetical protein